MTLSGTIVNGAIVLDAKEPLPEGARVTVMIEVGPGAKETLRDVLMQYAGCMKELPADMAAQHDHYLHGTSKR